MKTTLQIAALSTFGLIGAMGTSIAADMNSSIVIEEPPVVIEEPPLIVPEPLIIEDSGFYLRGDAGAGMFQSGCFGKKKAFTGDVGVGYQAGKHFRTDVTVSYSGKYKAACSNTHAWTAMLNGYVDFLAGSAVSPYLGVGAGWLRAENSVAAYKDDALAVSAMAGLSLRASQKVDIDLGYRFTYADISGASSWKDHAIRVGLRLSVN